MQIFHYHSGKMSDGIFPLLYLGDSHWQHPWLGNIDHLQQDKRPETRQHDHSMPFIDMYPGEPFLHMLPESIKVVETLLPTGRHRGVFCSQPKIAKGTRYGPFTGNILLPQEMGAQDNNSVWEVGINLHTTRGAVVVFPISFLTGEFYFRYSKMAS